MTGGTGERQLRFAAVRMHPGVDFLQGDDADFSIDLRRLEPGVTEGLLDDADVSAVAVHARGKGVADQMTASGLQFGDTERGKQSADGVRTTSLPLVGLAVAGAAGAVTFDEVLEGSSVGDAMAGHPMAFEPAYARRAWLTAYAGMARQFLNQQAEKIKVYSTKANCAYIRPVSFSIIAWDTISSDLYRNGR